MPTVDLNCDMGESTTLYEYSLEKDIELMRYVSSVNLACGYHAGDAYTMHRLVECALERNIGVGAHPGFPDKENFGRKEMRLSPEMLYDSIIYQLGALQGFLGIYGSKLHHVKPHGALYNMAAREQMLAEIICNAVIDFGGELILYALSGSELIRCAEKSGLKTASEGFADRTYCEDGSLTPRSGKNAMVEDETVAVNQALQIASLGTVTAWNGTQVSIKADTICIHGDGAHAVNLAKAIHDNFNEHHVTIQQPR
ncbi:MAG: 5-oxoprolinase subunit PxpA [Chitinophagaceae bacterium]